MGSRLKFSSSDLLPGRKIECDDPFFLFHLTDGERFLNISGRSSDDSWTQSTSYVG